MIRKEGMLMMQEYEYVAVKALHEKLKEKIEWETTNLKKQ